MNRTTSSRRKRWFFARAMHRAYHEMLEKGRKKRSQANKRELFAEALEPRVLFSGTPAPDPEAANEEQAQDADAMAQTAELLDAVVESGVEGIEGILEQADEADLTEEDIERLAREAVARWEKSGLTNEQREALENISYVVTDLGGGAVGATEGNVIYLDDDGAGYDWFVDDTEWLDEEFVAYEGYLDAVAGDAIDAIDLLTVIMHEQGHILGIEDLSDGAIDGIMFPVIGEGERRVIEVDEADGADPLSLEGVHFMTTFTLAASGNIDYLWTTSDWGAGANYPGETATDDIARVNFTASGTQAPEVDLEGGTYTIDSLLFTEGAGNADGNFKNGTLNVSNITFLSGDREIDFETSTTIKGPDGGDLTITNTTNQVDFRGTVSTGTNGSITVDGSRVVRFNLNTLSGDTFNHSFTNRDDGLIPGVSATGSYVHLLAVNVANNTGAAPTAQFVTYNVNTDGWLRLDRNGNTGTQALSVTNLSINNDVFNYRSNDGLGTRILTDNLVINNGGNDVTINVDNYGRLFLNGQISGDPAAGLIFSGNGAIENNAALTSTRTGTTTIAGGVLRLVGTNEAYGTGDFIIKEGATLDIRSNHSASAGTLPSVIVEAYGALTGDLRGYTTADYGAIGSGAKIELAENAVWTNRNGGEITVANTTGLAAASLFRSVGAVGENLNLQTNADLDLFKGFAFTGDSANAFRGTLASRSGQDLDIRFLDYTADLTPTIGIDGNVNFNSATGVVNMTLHGGGVDFRTQAAGGMASGGWTTMNITGISAETAHDQHIIMREGAAGDAAAGRLNVGAAQTLNISNARLNLATNLAGDTIEGTVNINSGGVLYLDDADTSATAATSGTYNINDGGFVWINRADDLERGATFNFAAGATIVIDGDLDPTGQTNLQRFLDTPGITIVFDDSNSDTLVGDLSLVDNTTLSGKGASLNDFDGTVSFDSTGSDGTDSVKFIAAKITQADGDLELKRLDFDGAVNLAGVEVQIGEVNNAQVTVINGDGRVEQHLADPNGDVRFHDDTVLGDVTVESGRLYAGNSNADTFVAESLTHNSTETTFFARGSASITNDLTVTNGFVEFDRADEALATNIVGGNVIIDTSLNPNSTGQARLFIDEGDGSVGVFYTDKVIDGTFAAGEIRVGQGGQFRFDIRSDANREGPYNVLSKFVISGDNTTAFDNSQLYHDIQGNTSVSRTVFYTDIQLEDGSVLGINEGDGASSATLTLRGDATLSALGNSDPIDIVDVSSNTPGMSRILTIGEPGEGYLNAVTGTVSEDVTLNVEFGSIVNLTGATLNGGVLGTGGVSGTVVVGAGGFIAGGGSNQQGTLTVDGNVSFAAGGTFMIQVDDVTDTATTVQVLGDIDFTNASIDFLSGSLGNDDSYTILYASGSISGLTQGLVFGDYQIDIESVPGSVRLLRADVPVIAVTGNGVTITHADTTTSTEDDTNLGARLTVGPDIFKTFTIANNGTKDLTINDISISELRFDIVNATLGAIAPGGSVTFDVEFSGDITPGDYTATVTIDHDDNFYADGATTDDPFTFDVSATQSIFASQPQTTVEVTGGQLVITDANTSGGKNDALTITDDGTSYIIKSTTGAQDIQALVGVAQTNGQEVSISKASITNGITFNLSGEASAGGDVIILGDVTNPNFTVPGDFIVNDGDVQLGGDVVITAENVTFNGSVDSDSGQNRALSFGAATGTVTINGNIGATDALASFDTSNASATVFASNAAVTQTGLALNWDASLDRGDGTFWDSTVNATDLNSPSTLNINTNRWDWTGVNTLDAGDVSATSNFAGITRAYELGVSGASGANMGSFENEVSVVYNGNDSDWSNENFAFEMVFRTPDLTGNHVLWESGGNPAATMDGTVLQLNGDQLILTVTDSSVVRTATLTLPSANEFHQVVFFIGRNLDYVQMWLDGGDAAGGTQVASSETGGAFNDWTNGNNSGLGRANDGITLSPSPGVFDGDIALVRAYRIPVDAFGDAEVMTNWNVLNQERTTSVSVNTTGAQTYSASLTLGASTTLNASEVTFNGGVEDDGNVATLSDLSITATAGDVIFNGNVGGSAELSSITTLASGTVQFNVSAPGDPLTVKSSGSQAYSGAVAATATGATSFTADSISFGGTTSFAGDASFLADSYSGIYYTSQPDFNGRVTFGSTATFAGTSTVLAESFSFGGTLDLGAGTSRFLATNNGTFSGLINGSAADLDVQVANVTDFSGGMNVASINTYFGGYTKIGGNVILGGSLDNAFNNQVLITGGVVTIDTTSGSGGITFGSTIDSLVGGNQSLAINADKFIVFGGSIGTDALGSLSQDNGLGSLTTGGVGTVIIRNNGTGYNNLLDPIDGDGPNLFLNYVAGLDRDVEGTNALWEDLVGRYEDVEGSNTIDYLGSNNFGDLDLNTNGAPNAVTDSAHQGIHAAFTSPAVGRSLEDFFPINNVNLSNVDTSIEVWARLNSGYTTDAARRVIWETGTSGASQPGMALSIQGSVVTLAAQEDDDRLDGSGGATTRDAGGLFSVDLVSLGIDLADFIQFSIVYDRDGGSGSGANNDIVRLYINGVEVGMIDNVDLDDISSGDDLGLGRQNAETGGYAVDGARPTANFNGELAIYRVWREALSAADVESTFDAVSKGITIETTTGVAFGSNRVTLQSDLTLGALIIGVDNTTTADQVAVTNGFNLELTGKDLLFDVGFPFLSPPAVNSSYTIIDNLNGSEGLAGVFGNAIEDTQFTANGFEWKVNYNAGDGNDVVLTFLGASLNVDAEVSLNSGVLTVSDATSDSPNNLTITEVSEGGVDYLVFSSAAGAVGIAAGSEVDPSLVRVAGDTVRIDKTLVNSLVIQTAFGGDEDTDSSEDSITINADLNLTGDLTVTADIIAVNGALSSGGTISLRGDTGVSLTSPSPNLTGNLLITGGTISFNTVLEVTGEVTVAGTSAVNLISNLTASGNVDISVTSPDPAVAAVTLSANLTSTLGDITLTGTKILGSSVTLNAKDVYLYDGDAAGFGLVNNTFGNTDLNGNILTVEVTGVDGFQTGRIIGAGSLVKEGSGTWDFNAYGDITNFPNSNAAPHSEVRNDFTGGPVLVNQGTLAIAKGSQWQGRAIRNTLDVIIASGATLDVVKSNTLGDLVRVQIDSGGTYLLNSADTIGSVTGAGALIVEGGTLQLRNDDLREFTGELTGDQNLLLLGQYNAERPWILTETGTGTYTGSIIIGNQSGDNIDANPQHALFVNGITDAQEISVRSQQENNRTNRTVAGTLGGIGTIQSTVTSQILTTLKPGQDGKGSTTVGTLTVQGNVIMGAPSQDAAINAEALITPYYTKLEMRVDDANGTSDRLVVTGDLDISLTDLTLFEVNGSTVLSGSDDPFYTLMSYGGTLIGTAFNSVTGLPAGYEINFDTAGEIRLTTIEPAVINLNPSDDLVGLQVNSDLVIEFNQPILAGTGNITITGGVNPPLVIPIGDPQITISGSTLTINPGVNLELDTDYFVLIDATAVTDTSAGLNAFPGIADPGTWNFKTSDTPPPETVVRLENGVLTITDIEGDSIDNLTIIDDGLGQYVITDTGGLTVGAGIGVTDTDFAPNSVSVGKNEVTSIVINTRNASGDASPDVVTISSTIIRSGDITITAETIYLDAPISSTAGVVNFNGNVILNTDISLGGSRINFNGTVNSNAGQNRALSFEAGTGSVVFNSLVGGTDALSTLDTSNAAFTLLGDNPVVAQQPFLTLNWDAALDRGDGNYWDSTINAVDITAAAPLSSDRSGSRWDWTGVTTLAPTDVSATSNLAGITLAYDLGGANAGAIMGSFESEVGFPLRNGNDPNWSDENVAFEFVFSPVAADLVGGPRVIWETGSQPGEDGTVVYLENGFLKLMAADATVTRTVVLTTPLVAGQFYQVMALIDLGNDLAKLWLNGGTAAGGEQGVSAETGGTFNDWSNSRNSGIGRVNDWAIIGNSTPGINGLIAVMRAYRDVPDTFGDLEAKTNWDVLNTARTSAVGVTTTGSQTYSTSVTLGASATLSASNVTFGGTVDDDGNGATLSDLTVNTTSGDIIFSGSVGGAVELTGLTTGATGTVHFNGGTVSIPLQVKTSGSQSFGGDVVTDGSTGFIADHLSFQGTTDFGGDASFRADAVSDLWLAGQAGFTGQVTFSGAAAFAGTASLSAESFNFGSTLNLGAGVSSFLAINTGTFSDRITGSGTDLNVQVANVTDFAKGMEVASITTYFGGYTKLGGDVILSGLLSSAFNNQVLITGGNVLVDATSGSAGVTFGSSIDSADGGNQSLTVNSNGDMIFGGNIGDDSLGSLSQDSGLGSLTTGGTGNVFLRNNGTGFNRLLDPTDSDGPNLFLNYVASLDPASIDLWEDLVGAREDLEGSATLDYLNSNNFGDLDLNINAAPTPVSDSAHQGIRAAFTSPAVGRGLEDFYPVNNANLSNVDTTVEIWARLNSGYETDTTARVIWETGTSGPSQPGMALSVVGSVVTLAAQEDDDRLTGEGAGNRDAGGLFTVDLGLLGLGIDLDDFVQFTIAYDRDGGSGTSPNNDIVSLYINGALIGVIDNVDLDDISSSNDLGLGRQSSETGGYALDGDRPTGNFNGEFAIYRVWRESLDANQVQATFDTVHDGITINTTAGTFFGNTATAEVDLSLSPASQLQFALDSSGAGGTLGGTNQLVLPGGVNLDLGNAGDNLLFNVAFGFATAPALDTTYTLIDNQNASGGISGEFENASDNVEFDANGYKWRVNYDGGDGNDVVLTYRGISSIVDAEVSLNGGVLTISDVLSDTVNALTITEESDGGVDYIVISDSVGSIGIASGSETPITLQRTAPATVRIDKTLVDSIVIQTSFTGDESTDVSDDSVTVDTALVLSGPLTITADTINVNATLSASINTLNGATAVNLNSNLPTVTGDLIVDGGSINVNTELNGSGIIDFAAATSVTLGANVIGNGNVNIAVASPDPAVGAINLSGTVTSTTGNIVLTGTKNLNANVTLSGVSVVLLDGDAATSPDANLGVTELNGNTLTIDVSGGYVRNNANPENHRNLQTGRISGTGSIVKTGSGEWNLMAYADITNLPNVADGNYNDFPTGTEILVQGGTLSIKDGSPNQSRASRSFSAITVSDGATFALNRSVALQDQVSVHIETGGFFVNNSGDLIGKITGSGTLDLQSGNLQSRNDPAEFGTYSTFNGELIGDSGLYLRGQNNAEQPWILTETGTGTFTGTILIGVYGGNSVGPNSQHALYVNGITDATLIEARSYQSDNNTNIGTGTIGGIGTIQANVNSQILTTFRPGQDGIGGIGMGTLTVDGNVTLGVASSDPTSITSGNTRLEMRIDDANGTSDKLVVNGDLDISNTILTFFAPDGTTAVVPADDPGYTLITYTGTLTGNAFVSEANIPTGYEVVIDTAAKEIRLVTIAPAIVTLTPADDSSGYQVDNDLVIEFNQNIAIGAGNITIFDDTNSSSVVIPIGDAQISISGNILTINPPAELLLSTDYHIEIDSGAITDTDGVPNAYTGIGDTTTWNFTTSATPPPETLVTFADGVLTITDVKTDNDDALVITDDGFGRLVITDSGLLSVGAGVGVADRDVVANSVTILKSGITSIVVNTGNGTDMIIISDAISLSGAITINAEAITLNGSLESSGDVVSLNGAVTIEADINLSGTEVNFSSDLTLGATAKRSVTISGNTTLGGKVNMRYDGTGSGSSDTLAVTGDLDVSAATLALSQLNAAANDTIYGLITYSGTLTGPLAGVTGVPVGYAIDSSTANQIRLVNLAPVFTTAAAVNTPENQTAVIDVNATDPEGLTDGSGLTYTIAGGADQSLFDVTAAGLLTFKNAQDFETPGDAGGDNIYNVQVQVTDGVNSVTQDIVVTLTNVNEAPVLGATPAMTVSEGGTVAVSVATVGNPTDVDDVDTALTVTVSNVTNGRFERTTATGTPITTFTVAEVVAGAIQFVHDGGEDAPTYSVVVADDESAGSGAPQAATIGFTNVNDAPVLTGDLAATVAEGGTYAILAADLGYTDPDDADAGVTFTTSSATNGKIQVNGADATTFTGTQLAAGQVTFVHDSSETAVASFAVNVEDGNEDSSGPTNSTFNFVVTPVNDAPVLTGDLAATVAEGGTYTIEAADLGYTDSDDNDAGVTFATSSAVNGKIQVNGSDATTFTGTQLAAGQVTFVHDSSETLVASFAVNVDDGNEDSSAPTNGTFNFTVTPVNDAPVLGATPAMTLSEGQTVPVTAATVGNPTDVDDVDAALTVMVSNVTNGRFERTTATGTPITTFTVAEVVAGAIQFVHDGGEDAPTYSVVVADDESAGTGAAQAATISFTNVNDVPVATVSSVSTNEDTAYTFATGNFNFTDAEGNALASITVQSLNLSTGDFLKLSGADVTVGQTITAANLVNLIYTPAPGANGAARSTFTFTVNDVDSGTVAATMTINVGVVNDAPVITEGAGPVAVSMSEDGSPTAFSTTITATDPDAGETASLVWTIVSPATNGTASIVVGTATGGTPTINYAPTNPHFSGTDSFTLRVTDTGGLFDEIRVDVTVNAVADAPNLVANDVAGNEDTAIALGITSSLVDTDGSETLSIAISGVPVGAVLSDGVNTFTASAGTTSVDVSTWDLANLSVTPPANSDAEIVLTVTATATEGSNSDTASTVDTFTVSVAAVADVPTLDLDSGTIGNQTSVTVSGNEDTAIALDISGALNDTDGSETLGFLISGVPAGALFSAGTNNGGGNWTVTAAQAAGLTITPPLNDNADFILTVTARATESNPTSGDLTVDTLTVDSAAGTIAVTVNPVNDAPILGAIPVMTLNEGQTVGVTLASVGNPTDVDDLSGALTVNVSNVTNGRFERTTAAGTPITSFTVAQVTGGTIQFVHNGGETAPTYSVVVADDTPANTGAAVAATITFSGVNDLPVANADTNVVYESGVGGQDVAIGNALGNDTDADIDGVAPDDVLSIDRIGFNGTDFNGVANASAVVPGGGTASINGFYGTLQISAGGGYVYSLDSNLVQVRELQPGQTRVENFSYRVSDGNGGFDVETLVITLKGAAGATIGSQVVSGGSSILEGFEPTQPGAFLDKDDELFVDSLFMRINPNYAGSGDPGDTIRVRLYDGSGNVLGEQTVVAGESGRWAARFSLILGNESNVYVEVQTTPANWNFGNQGITYKTFLSPSIDGSLGVGLSGMEPLSVESIFGRRLTGVALEISEEESGGSRGSNEDWRAVNDRPVRVTTSGAGDASGAGYQRENDLPESVEELFLMAQEAAEQEDYSYAIFLLETALERQPDFERASDLLEELKEKEGQN